MSITMAEMAELSELYEECNDLQMDVMLGEGDLAPPPEEVGPMEEEAGAAAQPMAAAAAAAAPRGKSGLGAGPGPGEQPGPMAAAAAAAAAGLDFESEDEEFDDWEDEYEYPEADRLGGAGYRVSAALEEANKMFLRTSRAREAALDGGFQMHYEKTPFDQLAFIEELFSLMVVNRLTEELGCDEIIDRE
ncbi:EP300-interacting inhibitor of differentiation 1 isoform X1 [Perognathus longimembris pacificus]|uniref:EP300-interacting inhibitor of differentiation 1 isoform X1 n=1 Tax=Perognathus longimembris pacificus TaxID=214514 RepID=UPI002019202E|nr:EP300-interacting inhibitor of differentiation 1 isoform X1 [Perognathus longimembris pacificus]